MDEASYNVLAAEAAALVVGEPDVIANMANLSCLLWHALNKRTDGAINWLGFYRHTVLADGTAVLVLGPFHGGQTASTQRRTCCM